MKTFLTLTAFFLCGLGTLSAQTATVPQPDFVNVPAYYFEGKEELKNLSKETVNMVGKIGEAVYELPGTASSVRIKSGDKYVLVIKAGDYDPSSMMTLYRLTPTKKARQASMATAARMGTAVNMNSKDAVPYQLKKLADKVYQIVPEQKLAPGEYMFVIGNVPYSFGLE